MRSASLSFASRYVTTRLQKKNPFNSSMSAYGVPVRLGSREAGMADMCAVAEYAPGVNK
jgi:hypothetical protein